MVIFRSYVTVCQRVFHMRFSRPQRGPCDDRSMASMAGEATFDLIGERQPWRLLSFGLDCHQEDQDGGRQWGRCPGDLMSQNMANLRLDHLLKNLWENIILNMSECQVEIERKTHRWKDDDKKHPGHWDDFEIWDVASDWSRGSCANPGRCAVYLKNGGRIEMDKS